MFACALICTCTEAFAADEPTDETADYGAVFSPRVMVGKTLDLNPDGSERTDSIKYVEMSNIYVYGPLVFKNDKQRRAYDKLVRNVKRTLPLAKQVNHIVVKTYDEMQDMSTDKERKRHIKEVEKQLKADYTPKMKKLSLSQGKLLIKLVYRETNSSSYELVKVFLGSTKASFYQAFAWMFGASLKKVYDPEGEDKMTERVVRMVEAGQL